jgi:hypothetical protein
MSLIAKGKSEEIPRWKAEQRRIVRICNHITGDGRSLWKIPRTGLRIPDHALFAMSNHGA